MIELGWLFFYYGMCVDFFIGELVLYKGLDFVGKVGDNVIVMVLGIVIWVGECFGYGYLVEIDYGDGYVFCYGYNDMLKVLVGDVVMKG